MKYTWNSEGWKEIGGKGCALWASKKEFFRDGSANIFNYEQRRNSRAALAGPNSCGFFIRAKPRLRYARWFVRCNALFKNNFHRPSGKGRDPFLRDYTSSPIEIGLKTNLLFHVRLLLPPPSSLFSRFLFCLPFSLFSFFKRSSILVRTTEGGGVTFASYEISIGGESMEDPSDYTSPLQRRRVFCPSLFGPKSENSRGLWTEGQRFHGRNPIRTSIETILINSWCFFLSLFFFRISVRRAKGVCSMVNSISRLHTG